MARVNISIPDELAAEVRTAGLNVSRVAQEALRDQLSARRTGDWLADVKAARPSGVTHQVVLDALDEARREAGDEWPVRRTAHSS